MGAIIPIIVRFTSGAGASVEEVSGARAAGGPAGAVSGSAGGGAPGTISGKAIIPMTVRFCEVAGSGEDAGAGAAGSGAESRSKPQPPQNRPSAGLGVPHWGHFSGRGAIGARG